MRDMSQLWRTSKNWYRQWREKYLLDFIFIHINKTAGSSIEKALGIRFRHMTARESLEALGANRWEKRFSFTIVRNPWDKVVSHYHYRVQTNKTELASRRVLFPEWVRLAYGQQDPEFHQPPKMFLPQWEWISDESGQCLLDFVGRYESLHKDFAEICRRINRKSTLPHVKQSNRGRYQDYYDDTTREIVANWYWEDISKFNYVF
jgi:hypothetical protein